MAWTSYTQVLLLTVELCLWLSPLTLCIEVVIPPESVVVVIDSEAVFTCETRNAPSFAWRVNGTFFARLDASLRADLDTDQETVGDNELYTLTIPARAEYNGTVVQCVASEPGGAFVGSGNATLMIQGLLAAVGDVSVENGSDSILLSWSPPFSLDVTGVDPDIWYTVLISNVTDEDNPTAIPCTDCHNLTQPHYTFTTANSSPCHKYSFTVIPQNGAGEGSRSEPVEGALVDMKTEFDVSRVKPVVTYLSKTAFAVSLDLHLVGTAVLCSYDYVVYIENETAAYDTGRLPLLSGFRLVFTVSTLDSGLDYNSKYNMTIEGNEMFNASSTFLLSTFDVQSVTNVTTEEASDGTIVFMVAFIVNSTAKGYFYIVKCSTSSPDQMMAVLNTSSPAVVTGLEPNTYDIVVYDVEETGLPNETPAVEIKNIKNCSAFTYMESAVEKTVNQGERLLSLMNESLALDSVTISSHGDQLNITCHFRNYSSLQKCVIVCRKPSKSVLMVKDYPMGTDFPVKLNISENGINSVAVFGWSNGVIESLPVAFKQVVTGATTTSTETASKPTPIPEPSPSSSNELNLVYVGIVGAVGIVVLMVLVGVVGFAVILVAKKKKKKTMFTPTPIGGTRLTPSENTHLLPSPDPTTPSPECERLLPPESSGNTTPSSVHYPLLLQQQANPQPLLYAELGPRPEGLPHKCPPDDPPTQYATILPHATPPVNESEAESVPSKNVTKEVATGPPTLDAVVSMLKPVAKKWKEIGAALKMSEDFLDEVFTNMTSDEDCLMEAMDNWVKYHEPSWEKLATALREFGENELALKCSKIEPVSEESTPAPVSTSSSPIEESHTNVAHREVTSPSVNGSTTPRPDAFQESNKQPYGYDGEVTLPSLENRTKTPELESVETYQRDNPLLHRMENLPQTATDRDNNILKTSEEPDEDATDVRDTHNHTSSNVSLAASVTSLYTVSEPGDSDLEGEQIYQNPQDASN